MRLDVVDLGQFYATSLGQMARRLIRRRVRALWPSTAGMRVLGLGYATPYLRPFVDEAERVIAMMPASQGVSPGPPTRPTSSPCATRPRSRCRTTPSTGC